MPFSMSFLAKPYGYELTLWSDDTYQVRVHHGDTIEDVGGLVRVLIEECGMPLVFGPVMVEAFRCGSQVGVV